MAEINDKFSIGWIDFEREPKCEPNPNFPKGIDIKTTSGVPGCKVDLPYPAKRCGLYVVKCSVCDMTIGVTTAGRPDDPRSVEVPCKALLN